MSKLSLNWEVKEELSKHPRQSAEEEKLYLTLQSFNNLIRCSFVERPLQQFLPGTSDGYNSNNSSYHPSTSRGCCWRSRRNSTFRSSSFNSRRNFIDSKRRQWRRVKEKGNKVVEFKRPSEKCFARFLFHCRQSCKAKRVWISTELNSNNKGMSKGEIIFAINVKISSTIPRWFFYHKQLSSNNFFFWGNVRNINNHRCLSFWDPFTCLATKWTWN